MLIQTVNDIKNVMQVSAATGFEKLAPHIGNAESMFIQSLLGEDMYAKMVEWYNNADVYKINNPNFSPYTPPDDVPEGEYPYAVTLWYAQKAIINMAYHIGYDVLSVNISDAGFGRLESDRIKSLFKYQEDNLKKYFMNAGMDTIDQMLAYMERNLNGLPEFQNRFAEYNSRIFPNTYSFDSVLFINKSRLTFLRLQQHIITVENLIIAPAIGKKYMDYIYDELAKPVTDRDSKMIPLLPMLREAIAPHAAALLMDESGADLTERGLYFKGVKNIINSDLVMPATETRITELSARNKTYGDRYVQRLRTWMSENWPGFDTPRSRLHERDNAGKKTFWA